VAQQGAAQQTAWAVVAMRCFLLGPLCLKGLATAVGARKNSQIGLQPNKHLHKQLSIL